MSSRAPRSRAKEAAQQAKTTDKKARIVDDVNSKKTGKQLISAAKPSSPQKTKTSPQKSGGKNDSPSKTSSTTSKNEAPIPNLNAIRPLGTSPKKTSSSTAEPATTKPTTNGAVEASSAPPANTKGILKTPSKAPDPGGGGSSPDRKSSSKEKKSGSKESSTKKDASARGSGSSVKPSPAKSSHPDSSKASPAKAPASKTSSPTKPKSATTKENKSSSSSTSTSKVGTASASSTSGSGPSSSGRGSSASATSATTSGRSTATPATSSQELSDKNSDKNSNSNSNKNSTRASSSSSSSSSQSSVAAVNEFANWLAKAKKEQDDARFDLGKQLETAQTMTEDNKEKQQIREQTMNNEHAKIEERMIKLGERMGRIGERVRVVRERQASAITSFETHANSLLLRSNANHDKFQSELQQHSANLTILHDRLSIIEKRLVTISGKFERNEISGKAIQNHRELMKELTATHEQCLKQVAILEGKVRASREKEQFTKKEINEIHGVLRSRVMELVGEEENRWGKGNIGVVLKSIWEAAGTSMGDDNNKKGKGGATKNYFKGKGSKGGKGVFGGKGLALPTRRRDGEELVVDEKSGQVTVKSTRTNNDPVSYVELLQELGASEGEIERLKVEGANGTIGTGGSGMLMNTRNEILAELADGAGRARALRAAEEARIKKERDQQQQQQQNGKAGWNGQGNRFVGIKLNSGINSVNVVNSTSSPQQQSNNQQQGSLLSGQHNTKFVVNTLPAFAKPVQRGRNDQNVDRVQQNANVSDGDHLVVTVERGDLELIQQPMPDLYREEGGQRQYQVQQQASSPSAIPRLEIPRSGTPSTPATPVPDEFTENSGNPTAGGPSLQRIREPWPPAPAENRLLGRRASRDDPLPEDEAGESLPLPLPGSSQETHSLKSTPRSGRFAHRHGSPHISGSPHIVGSGVPASGSSVVVDMERARHSLGHSQRGFGTPVLSSLTGSRDGSRSLDVSRSGDVVVSRSPDRSGGGVTSGTPPVSRPVSRPVSGSPPPDRPAREDEQRDEWLDGTEGEEK